MLFDTFELLWTQQRPARTEEEIMASLEHVSPEDIESKFSFEDRVAIRSLIHCVLDDTNLLNVFDGVLTPPPYDLLDLTGKRWHESDVVAIVSVLDPALDGLIVQVPFNLALRIGSYDARLRAACRRLCWVLNVPFSVVEAQEEKVALAFRALVNGSGMDDDSLTDSSVDKQAEVTARKQQRKRSLRRVATIGGFAVLGGAALVLTGGLAAPLVAPAFAALVTATTVTIGAIGSVGTAVLGSSALAAVFAGIVGVGTHAAALAAVLTPVLTAANVTAIFGVGGATLAGYKAYRRTGDSDTFIIRSVDEVETFTGKAESEPSAATDATVAALTATGQAVQKDADGLLGTNWDLSSVVEEGSKPSIVVPSHTRSVSMTNVANRDMIKKRNRRIVFGVESALPGYELRLQAIKVLAGVWGVTPAALIPDGTTAVCASMNRYMRPTGTGFILCYVAQPVSTAGGRQAFRVWIRVSYDFLGKWELSSFCEEIKAEFEPFKAEMRLETNAEEDGFTKSMNGLTMEMHAKPFLYLKVYPSSAVLEHARKVTFPVEELPQRQIEYAHDVKQRRKIGVSFVNNSKHTVYVSDINVVNGVQWTETASPMVVEPRIASLTFFTNASWSLEGAEVSYILEVRNANEPALTPTYFVRLQLEISAMNNMNLAVASAPTMQELRQMELTAETPAGSSYAVEVKAGLFFGLNVRTNARDGVVQLCFGTAVERDAGVAVAERASLLIGVCGYSAVFDARRPVQDQQVGLWQPVLRDTPLLGVNESYALQWEDEYLGRFGETLRVDLQVADLVSKKAIGKAKSTVKRQLMQGAIFSGFKAFHSFLGAFELPLYAVWASDVIDNTFATLSNRAVFAGKDLATALLSVDHGRRPVSLVGFSFGSKVIAECLEELGKVEAFNIVENVYLMGCTFSADRSQWERLRRVVAGRLVNIFTRSDWALWLMYKANEGDPTPMAGVTPVGVPGVENVDASGIVQQHGAYALHLREVLGLVPPMPTEESWRKESLRGSPGVIVPSAKAKSTVKAIGSALSSTLASTPYSAFAVRNSVVSDTPDLRASLELVTVSTLNCFFDFIATPEVECGCAGVFGVVGEDSSVPSAGVFSYRLRLNQHCERDVLLLFPFYIESNNDVCLAVRPSLVTQRLTREELAEDADARFEAIAAAAVSSVDDARRLTADTAGMSGVVTPATESSSTSVEVPLDGLFTDGHRNATLILTVQRVSGGVLINVLALLRRAASQLQQESFTEQLYMKEYSAAALVAASAVLGSGNAHGGGALPDTAKVQSIDLFQNTLVSIASSIKPPARTSAEGEDRPVCDDSDLNAASPTEVFAQSETFIIVANCGSSSLYFGEEAYSREQDETDNFEEADDVTPAVQPGTAQWVSFPPPEIPPHSFCVLSLTNFEKGAFPRVRYETAKSDSVFDIRASAVSEERDDSQAADKEDQQRIVLCSMAKHTEDNGEISTSTTMVRGVRFHLVLLTPGSASERSASKGEGGDEAYESEVHDILASNGWFVL